MVENGGTVNFSVKCHNIKLTIGEYVLNSQILSIPMGGSNVVPAVQWLQSLGMIGFNFQEFFLNLFWEGKDFELWGIVGKQGKIINYNGMKMLMNKEQWGIIAQLCSVGVQTSKSSISLDIQKVLDNNLKVFETPKASHLFVIMIM